MPEVLTFLDAFLQERRRCSELEAGVELSSGWPATAAGMLVRALKEPSKANSPAVRVLGGLARPRQAMLPLSA
jgi:hypothetical protein